jgi:hypothetical protein
MKMMVMNDANDDIQWRIKHYCSHYITDDEKRTNKKKDDDQ